MEGALGVGGQPVHLLQQRQLLGFQRIAARAEQVQRLAVPEEHGLLALVDDQLGTIVEVLDGVLPHEGVVVALILDDAGQAVPADLLRDEPLLHVIFTVADRADERRRALSRRQPDAALAAGEGLALLLVGQRVHRRLADWALRVRALGLIEYDLVAAVRALAGRQLVRAHVDDVPAGAFDLLPRKETRPGLGILAAGGTRDCKLRHMYFLPIFPRSPCSQARIPVT